MANDYQTPLTAAQLQALLDGKGSSLSTWQRDQIVAALAQGSSPTAGDLNLLRLP